MTYDNWLKTVNEYVEDVVGVPADELNDWLARDAFDAGETPMNGARRCIANLTHNL